MINEDWQISDRQKRRAFLGSVATTGVTAIAGCGDSNYDDSERNSPKDKGTIQNQQIDEEVENLESIFSSLSELPIADGGEFVFDVKQFEAEFNHRSLLQKLEETQNQIDSMTASGIPESTVNALQSIAEIADLLVQQRVIIHQVIAAGLTCERRFYEMEIEAANEAINNAIQFVADLDSNGQRIEETLRARPSDSSLVDGYDPEAIKRTQDVIVDIALWTNPAYEGLHRSLIGMKHFMDGNSAVEEERYEAAESTYRDSNNHFERAQEAFETAHNRGSKMSYLAPFVEDIRCIVPAYVSSSERLRASMRHFQSGEQARGKEIAREAIESAEQIAPRCF